jgi:lipid-A-disaccharide synthase
MKKIMVSAGEVSGDIHGTHLVRELKKLDPNLHFFGMGSENLLSEGVDIKLDISRRGTIGIFEALPNIIPLYLTYFKLVSMMKKEKPDILLLIDSQGINMPLAKAAKKLGIKTVYYIPPQEWLWGTTRGVKKVTKTVDQIISIFEKEHNTYKAAGGNSVYFGHPLVDVLSAYPPNESKKTNLTIALCPGSRTQEIKGLLPVLLRAGKIIQQSYPNAEFIIPAASTNMIKKIFSMISNFRPKAIVGQTREVLARSDLAICASGTINLEASILGVPNIMVYKLSPLTYFLGKYILKIGEKLPFFSMPNYILNEKVIPELVMKEANPQNIAEEALSILNNSSRQQRMKDSFNQLKTKLGSSGVIPKIAKAILETS